MLKCQEVEQRADALVDGRLLSRRERLSMSIHLLICRYCRRYLRQLQALVLSLRTREETLPDSQTEAIIDRVYGNAPP